MPISAPTTTAAITTATTIKQIEDHLQSNNFNINFGMQQRPSRGDDERASALMAECAGADPMESEQWEKFCRVYPNLLHPIFKLQKSLQVRRGDACCGTLNPTNNPVSYCRRVLLNPTTTQQKNVPIRGT